MTTWKQITCEEREALIDERGRSHNGFSTESGVGVISGRTDLGGFPPIIETVWGEADETPVLKDVRHPARHDHPDDKPQPDLKPCEHWVPETAVTRQTADDIGYNIVNQLADLWNVPVDVRQATNDHCWKFVAELVASASSQMRVDRLALAKIDNGLRSGSRMTAANVGFEKLCRDLGVNRDSLAEVKL